MISNKDKAQCSGCTACEAICVHKAIKMKPDALGFLYPMIDVKKCINCGLCDKVCAFNDYYDITSNLSEPKFYGARHLNIHEVNKSRSGGVFAALSDEILRLDGCIYGAAFSDVVCVEHKRARTKEERDAFRGSKYVQSDMADSIKQMEKDLRDGRFVLFSGTPCQVAGVKNYFKIKKVDTEKLLLCDIVCHGVPSPYIWRDYVKYMEERFGGNVESADFRDKSLGWAAHKESFIINGKKIVSDTYTYTFYKHIMFRHSCGKCHYTNLKRVGDITLGDFWGYQNADDQINMDNRGISLIIVNTPKGEEYFNKVSNELVVFSTIKEKCLQPNLQAPSKIDPRRDDFEDSYSCYGFKKTMSKFGLMGWRYDFALLKRRIKHKIRKIIKCR